jgi:hypothetical protein
LAAEAERLVDRHELRIGAQRGEFGDPVAARIDAERLVIVPEEGLRADGDRLPSGDQQFAHRQMRDGMVQ